jgi:hypothetical protein
LRAGICQAFAGISAGRRVSKFFFGTFCKRGILLNIMPTGKGALLVFAGFLAVSFGCATRVASPGVTLWAGLNNYHETMRTLEARPERWPDRQRLAESIKTTYVATLGGSREFNRLVDLDLKRRELVIVQREGGLKADRAKQIEEELIKINEQVHGLKSAVKAQFTISRLSSPDNSQTQTIETVATLGLLNLAIDAFSATSGSSSTPTSQATTAVGPYIVIDEGFTSAVRTPEGQTFRCMTAVVPEEGAFMRCESATGKTQS